MCGLPLLLSFVICAPFCYTNNNSVNIVNASTENLPILSQHKNHKITPVMHTFACRSMTIKLQLQVNNWLVNGTVWLCKRRKQLHLAPVQQLAEKC